MISITRYEDLKRWKMVGKWVLVYGRRKTGKSYFVKNFVKHDKYFFIGRGGKILEGDNAISYDIFLREVFENLKNNKTIVIDEIQRLPEEFHDRLHASGIKGNLIAISSTLWIAKKLLGKRSPLLGLFSEFKMDIIDERDILINLAPKIKDYKTLIEVCTYLREPLLIPLWEANKESFLNSIAISTKLSVPALIGEIFSEEERELSAVYEGVLKAVADGKRVSGEIAQYLYSLRLIPYQNPSFVHPYLKSLFELGLLKKIKVFGRKKYYYYNSSPVIDLFYYLDAKYGFSERDISPQQIEKISLERIPFHVEQFFRNLLSKLFGLWSEIISKPEYEIDIALTDFKKLKVIAEVKWKNRVNKKEIEKIEEVFSNFDCRKILIVPDRKALEKEPKGIEVWDVRTILTKIKNISKNFYERKSNNKNSKRAL